MDKVFFEILVTELSLVNLEVLIVYADKIVNAMTSVEFFELIYVIELNQIHSEVRKFYKQKWI